MSLIRYQIRDSDGNTIDLSEQEAEEAETNARAKRVFQVDSSGNSLIISDVPRFFEDTNFVTGDSPVTLDFNAGLGRNATEGTITNDGSGNFTISFSTDGTVFGDEITMKNNEIINFNDISVDSLRITWIADSAYRVVVI